MADETEIISLASTSSTRSVSFKAITKTGATTYSSTFVNQHDAPSCPNCGHIAVRNGACYKCMNCGESLGCS